MDQEVKLLLEDKNPAERALLARSVEQCLNGATASLDDQRAAEELARHLANDAIKSVREELSKAVSGCKFLPRDVAMVIAHDIDDVACPFLEVTEVFSDDDWRDLVCTISTGGQIAVAGRISATARSNPWPRPAPRVLPRR